LLNDFAAACDNAGMKISTSKTEVLHLSINPDQCSLQVSGVSLKQVEKFKYLGIVFTSDGRQDEELNTRMGKAFSFHKSALFDGAHIFYLLCAEHPRYVTGCRPAKITNNK